MSQHLKSSTSLSGLAELRLEIEYVSIEALKPGPNQTRRHTRRQLKQLGHSIRDHDFLIPVVTYGDSVIAAGNARVAAAKLIGLHEVPVVRAEHLSDEQMRLFAIADNKLAEGVEWIIPALAIEFAEIALAAPDLDQGLSGFSISERDIIFGRQRTKETADLDDGVAVQPVSRPTAKLGDVLKLGRHMVTCGDATDPQVIARVVGDRRVRTVVSDPPYNVRIAGNVSGLDSNKHAEFAMGSGEFDKSQFIDFLARAIGAAQPHLDGGALLYLFMDWRHIGDLVAASEATELAHLNLLVWAKPNAGMGSFYRLAYELVGVFKHGKEPHLNNVELGRHGRNRINLVSYPGVNTFTKGRNKALELHPTVKPVALLANLILDSSAPGDFILDPFGGSGSTLIAAERTGRTACLVEIDPSYVDVIIRRFEQATGESAILAGTGQAFAQLGAERMAGEE